MDVLTKCPRCDSKVYGHREDTLFCVCCGWHSYSLDRKHEHKRRSLTKMER